MRRTAIFAIPAAFLLLCSTACGRQIDPADFAPLPTSAPTASPAITDEPAPPEDDTEMSSATEMDGDEATAEEAVDAEADPIAALIANSDLAAGEAIFNASYETASGVWACSNCHSVDEAQTRLIGPGMWGLHERADDRATESGDADGITYVANSIYHPNDYIVPDDGTGAYPPGLMPANYGDLLTEEEMNNLVAYLLSL